MANITITQLPTASALTGSELVPIVQSGVTVQTTTGAISGAGALNYPFLTVGSTAGLTQARYLSATTGLSLTDGGAGGTLTINMTGTAASLNGASTGFIVKDSASTVTNRQITVGSGMTVSNGDGVSGNPAIGLSQLLQNISSTSAVGLLTVNGNTVTATTIVGTTNQISVTTGNGIGGSPTVGIASNPILPGTGSVVLPQGTTAQRSGTNGALRYNTQTATVEAYANNAWGAIVSGSGVTSFSGGATGLTPNTPTSGGITLDGTLLPAYGGTGANTLTGYVYGNGTSTMTASTTIPTTALSGTVTNAQIANPQVTLNGTVVSLGATATITAASPNALTISTGLTGTSYNGSAAVTIAIDSTVATLTGSQTLTNKTISGASNTLSNIGNSSLTNSSVTVGTTSVALGATSLTLGGLTSVAVTQDPVSALQLATKQYVDSVAQGLDAKASCVYGTTGNITLSGLGTQGNGDWTSSLTAGDRILVKSQTSSQFNGIYVASSSTWARALDMDTWAEVPSSFVFIEQGTTLADTGWVTTANAGGTIDVTPMPWVQFSGAGTYTAGTGLTLTGSQFSLTSPVTAALGGSGYTSYTTGDMLYASGSTALSKLAIGSANYVLTSTGTAPQYVAQSTLSVGSATTATTATTATNATNTAITLNSTNSDYYITVVSANTGNLPQLVATGLTANPSTGKITSGVSGGTF
jgi:hypothetical protein